MPPETYDYPTVHFLSDVWSFVKPYKWEFIFWSAVRAIAGTPLLLTPLILGKMVDTISASQVDIGMLWSLVAAAVIIEIITPTIRLKSKFHLNNLKREIQKDVRLKGLSKVVELDLSWHEDQVTGATMARITYGADMVSKFLDFWDKDGWDIIVSIVGGFAVFTMLDAKYGFLLLLTIAVYSLAESIGYRHLSEKRQQERKVAEGMFGKVYEFAHNIRTIKSLGLGKVVLKRAAAAEESNLRAEYHIASVGNRKWRVVQTLFGVFKGLFVVVVCYDIIRGNLSAGALLVYVTYFSTIQARLIKISDNMDGLIESKNGVYRLMLILDTHPEVEKGGDLKSVGHIDSLKFDGVDFSYKDKEVLSGVSFDIRSGERVGIVGQSGVGKSTLFKLLLKLYRPKSGSILINGIPSDRVKRDSITSHLSIVPQETELFNLSFKENVTMSASDFDRRRYNQAIRVSASDEIIERLPDKDASIIGEKGVRLSGGERQRLGIARAIYKGCDVILLDEATSHLDSRTERRIIDGMESSLKGVTLIVIAHRLSTLKSMDRILVFSGGSIVEQGSFASLLSKKGVFQQLHKMQSR
ncbi:MAG: ABC transporter ATP-binding protein [Nanoarchaeota archaeon]